MRPGLALALVLVLASGAAVAQEDANSRQASILVYHPWPDAASEGPQADPFATPLASGAHLFRDGRASLPLTRFDGVEDAPAAPEGDPASPAAHFQAMRAILQTHQRAGTPIEIELDATVADGTLVVDATVRGEGADKIRAVVFEDGIPYVGDSGVTVHRFVARLGLDARAPDDASWRVPLDDDWDATRIGVVVLAGDTATGETVQSASWLVGQHGPTVQRERAVLVEHATATWCQPCGPSDAALALLASQHGFPAPETSSASSYLAPPAAAAVIGLVGGAGLGLMLARRRWS